MLSDYDLKFIYDESNPRNRIVENNEGFAQIIIHSRRVAYYTYTLFMNCPLKDSIPEDENYMYLLGLFNSIGATLIAGASKNQLDYITELSKQYMQYGDNILDIFLHGNASTYLSMLAAKHYGFGSDIAYELLGWNGLALVPPENKIKLDILHIAEMIDFYSRGMIDFYQIDKKALKIFNIVDECQFKKLAKDLQKGFENDCGE